MKEYETILKVLGAKIQELELSIYCKDLRIEELKKEIEELKENKINEWFNFQRRYSRIFFRR